MAASAAINGRPMAAPTAMNGRSMAAPTVFRFHYIMCSHKNQKIMYRKEDLTALCSMYTYYKKAGGNFIE
jgi:hypothetical protein